MRQRVNLEAPLAHDFGFVSHTRAPTGALGRCNAIVRKVTTSFAPTDGKTIAARSGKRSHCIENAIIASMTVGTSLTLFADPLR
jgi:hypothetical protein